MATDRCKRLPSYLDPQPKSDPGYLYGRDKELGDLVGGAKKGDWAILLGPRRVGKTSLAKCAATKLGFRTAVVDVRVERSMVKGTVDGLATSGGWSIQGGASIPHTPIGVGGHTREPLPRRLWTLFCRGSRGSSSVHPNIGRVQDFTPRREGPQRWAGRGAIDFLRGVLGHYGNNRWHKLLLAHLRWPTGPGIKRGPQNQTVLREA